MTVYDVTRTLTPRTAVFPGDTPVTLTPTMQIAAGDACNVTAIAMSAHAGTHVDAPRHYSTTGAGVEAVPLDVLIGPARLVTLAVREIITVDDIRSALRVAHGASSTPVARLLIRTRASAVPDEVWEGSFVYFDPHAADWLGAHGVRLIGTDAPSVDPATSKALPAHKAFLRHNVVIVENLSLRDVPDGEYELIALPLKIQDNDAAPARVVLRR